MTLPDQPELKGTDAVFLENLVQTAGRAGASAAALVSTADIVCEQHFADMCREPRCENYGLSPGCPPHVDGPAAFQKRLPGYAKALVFRIDVPSEILFSNERRSCFQLLHETAAGIEQAAIDMGFRKSRAYAGGSCKQIFCHDRSECRVLAEKGTCRYPQAARHSMSGYGIDAVRLVNAAGWPVEGLGPEEAAAGRQANIYGLVLIG